MLQRLSVKPHRLFRWNGAVLAFCLLLFGATACEDLNLVEVDDPTVEVLVRLVPVMAPELATSPSDFDVYGIVLEVKDRAQEAPVASDRLEWSPERGEPHVEVRMQLPDAQARMLEGSITLNDASGTPMWSGRFSDIAVEPTETEIDVPIQMVRGDLSYLDIREVRIVWPDFLSSSFLADEASPSLPEGTSFSIRVETEGGPASPRVLWLSSNPDVLSISVDGDVEAHRPGETTITAIVGAFRVSLTVRVTQRVDRVEISPALIRLEALGLEASFSAQALDPRGDPVDGVQVAWTTDSSILESVGGGVFRGIANGTGTATARVGDVSASATVEVQQVAASIEVTPASWEATALHDLQLFSARVRDSNGFEMAGASAEWASDATAVVSIEPSGQARAEGTGSGRVTASFEELSAHAEVTVRQEITGILVEPAEVTLFINETATFTGALVDRNGNPVPGDDLIQWESLDTGIASIDRFGNALAVGTGTTGIRGRAGSVTGEAVFTSKPPPPPPTAAGDIYVFNDWNIWDTNRNPARLAQNLVSSANNSGTRVIWYCGNHPPGGKSGTSTGGGSICASSITSTAGGQFAGTANAIRNAGYTVEVTYDTPLTHIPDDVRVFWLWTPTQALTNAEINVLKSFAARGGRIVWNADYHEAWYFSHQHQNIATALLNALGTGIVSSGNLRNVGSVGSTGFSAPADPLLEGITSIAFGSPGDIQVSAPGVALVTAPGGHVLVARAPVDVTPLPVNVQQTMPALMKSQAAPASPPPALPPGCVPGTVCTP